MEARFTKGPWTINHWEKGESGVKCLKKEGNISYFSGDAINHRHFNIVSRISFKEHNIQGSFEGAHIAQIYDHSEESKANAILIAAAPELLDLLIKTHKSLVEWGVELEIVDTIEETIKKLTEPQSIEARFKSLIIYNENKLIEYIEGTSRMSAKHAIETTTLAEVKAKILEAANNAGDLLDYGIQVECMRGWDKVHVFEYKTHFKSELSVSYKGTMK